IDPADVLPPITAYYVMRVGRLPLVPYFRPGDMALAEAVRGFAGKHHAVLLANHGPVVAGANLDAAVNAIEELEETAKLYLLLRGAKNRFLTPAQIRRRDFHLENEIPQAFRGTRSALGATFEAADKYGWNLVHPVSANPNPSGTVADDAFETIAGMILDGV